MNTLQQATYFILDSVINDDLSSSLIFFSMLLHITRMSFDVCGLALHIKEKCIIVFLLETYS